MRNIIVLIFVFLFAFESYAQLDNSYISGATKEEVDTLAFDYMKENVKLNAGLLEKEIDPEKYIVGPNDIFSILINTSKTIQFKAPVSPSGVILLRGIGGVDVKENTLAEATDKMIKKIKSVYNTEEVYVVLEDIRKFKVVVSGTVGKPSTVQATAAERVNEAIDKAGGLKFNGSLRNITLYRDESNTRINVDLLKFYKLDDKTQNPTLLGGDHIIVAPSADNILIGIYGEIPSEGEFEFMDGDSLSTLIKFAQGFLQSSNLDSVEVVRMNPTGLEHKYLDLNSWRHILFSSSKLPNDMRLQSGDRVYIRKKYDWSETQYAVIDGEILYPGKYAIDEEHDKVYDLIKRAGGFTEYASLDHIEFIRQEELEIKDLEMERLSKMLPSEMSESESRYFQAKKTEKKGSMAIDFRELLNDSSNINNIKLRNKDSIIVTKKKYHINVQGRVNNPGLITYQAGYNYLDYINAAGGYGFRADESETIVTKQKGEQFLAENLDYKLEPGDVILVPPEKEYSFTDLFTQSLTVVTQLVSIVAIVITISK